MMLEMPYYTHGSCTVDEETLENFGVTKMRWKLCTNNVPSLVSYLYPLFLSLIAF